LGVDPGKATAAAPQGCHNVVFDLQAELVDPDGEGGEPPTGIGLSWTEQLTGDYDQNGLVTYSDLTPIGHHWLKGVAYDDCELHGGFADWPYGDVDDDGGTSPPAEGSGALNWRRARVDGNFDGVIELGDITPIAQHWEERLSGYRVYLKAPGEDEYALLGLVTAERTSLVPVRYSYEVPVDSAGQYRIFVAGYDDKSGTEGPQSVAVSIDVDTGEVNHAPVAVLTVTPDYGGVPARITLDASQSYDVDGDDIYDIYWDLDNDAQEGHPENHDFRSRDAIVPEASSRGAVIEIEPVPPAAGEIVTTLNCTYIQPYGTPSQPMYWNPYISVIDEHGLAGGTGAPLAISGWVTTVLNESREDYIQFMDPSVSSMDPATDEAVVAASYWSSLMSGFEVPTLWFARENGGERWTMEAVVSYDLYTLTSVRDIAWDEFGQPIILFTWDPEQKGYESLWSAQRRTDGTWDVQHRFSPGPPENPDNFLAFYSVIRLENGKFAGRVCETLMDAKSIFGTLGHSRQHVLFYDYADWRVDYTGYDNAEVPEYASALAYDAQGLLFGLFRVTENTPGGVWMSQWQHGAGFPSPTRIDDGSLAFTEIHTYCEDAVFDENGVLHALYVDDQKRERWYVRIGPGGETYAEQIVPAPQYDMAVFQGSLHTFVAEAPGSPVNVGYFVRHYTTTGTSKHMIQYVRYEGSSVVTEQIILRVDDYPKTPTIESTGMRGDGRVIAFIRHEHAEEPTENDWQWVQVLAERVDPRLWPCEVSID